MSLWIEYVLYVGYYNVQYTHTFNTNDIIFNIIFNYYKALYLWHTESWDVSNVIVCFIFIYTTYVIINI